jgi:quercetin dioxygenase-like cupin family protein
MTPILPDVIHPTGEAYPLNVFGVGCRVLLDGESSGGRCSIARLRCEPGPGAPLHRHEIAETFLVLKGRLRVWVDGDEMELAPGELAHVRPGQAHSFANPTDEITEFLAIGTPSGHEFFFRDADLLAQSGGFSPQAATAMCARHGIELAPTFPA